MDHDDQAQENKITIAEFRRMGKDGKSTASLFLSYIYLHSTMDPDSEDQETKLTKAKFRWMAKDGNIFGNKDKHSIFLSELINHS